MILMIRCIRIGTKMTMTMRISLYCHAELAKHLARRFEARPFAALGVTR